MDKKFVKDKIKEAEELVDGVEEPLKTAVFSVIFEKLLNGDRKLDEPKKHEQTQGLPRTSDSQQTDLQQGKQKLAQNCKITVEELDKVLDIKNDSIQLLISLKVAMADAQRLVAKCVLTAYSDVYSKEWVTSTIIAKCLQLSAISTNSLPRNLRGDNEIRIKGHGQGSELEYTITGPAKVATYNAIRTLAKGEEVLKSKSQ